MEYFKAHGIAEDQISVRFHGERYPLAANNSAANRARNRRVNIQLDRVTPVETAIEKAPETPAVPAAQTDTSKPSAKS
ncbi:flagellar motor protein MotD [compost metagenome]